MCSEDSSFSFDSFLKVKIEQVYKIYKIPLKLVFDGNSSRPPLDSHSGASSDNNYCAGWGDGKNRLIWDGAWDGMGLRVKMG